MRGCAATEQLNHLVAEILAPGSKANVNERDAAKILHQDADHHKGRPGLAYHAELQQLEAYYRRMHLGEMASHLTAVGA